MGEREISFCGAGRNLPQLMDEFDNVSTDCSNRCDRNCILLLNNTDGPDVIIYKVSQPGVAERMLYDARGFYSLGCSVTSHCYCRLFQFMSSESLKVE